MNEILKKIISKIVKIFLKNQKAFNFLQKEIENNILYNTLIKYKHLNIKCVYDIGANKAVWSLDMKKHFPSFNYFLFEASNKNKNALDKSKFKYFINCLSSEEKELDFYEIGGTGDSYYKEMSNYYNNIEPTKVKARKLSNLVIENNLPLPDFIKIDTQGSEIDILKGSDDIIYNCKLVLIEISINETNSNAPLIGEYISYFKSISFSPIEITEKHYSNSKILNQIDILFLNSKNNF